MIARRADVILPFAVLAAALGIWEGAVRFWHIEPFILPAPSRIAATLVSDWQLLFSSLIVTLSITLEALSAAFLGALFLAILFSWSRVAERAFVPFAVILQVTPIVAIAPLLLIYLSPHASVLICAFLVAFFPILANISLGLASTDRNLVDLFALNGATRWQQLTLLRLPSALPHLLNGLRVGGGLALIGAIVAELAAGAAGEGTGLAFRITEAGYRLNVPRMFAALFLISATGLGLYALFGTLAHLVLARWHDSARRT